MSKLLFLIIFFSAFPFFVLAQLDYPYPVIPGTTLTITEESTLGDLIKYLTSWAIIIGAIIAFLVLIYYGFIYLTSSFGAPERLSEAKSKIFNAFLGLAILIGSYVIMLLINPQFMILRLEKQPIDEGIVLLTKDGYNRLTNNSIEEIIMAGEAVFIPPKIPDLRKINLQGRGRIKLNFGNLIVAEWMRKPLGGGKIECDPLKTNFKNFTLTHIGFLPKSQENLKILFHSNENFKSLDDKGREYLPEGKIDVDGRIIDSAEKITIGDGREIKVTKIDLEDFKGFVKYEIGEVPLDCHKYPDLLLDTIMEIIPHPPLSLIRVPYGPGVYLYGDRIGEQIYFKKDGNYPKFKRGSFKAEKIELKNEPGAYDYIAVLFEKKLYDGDIKIIFESRGVKTMDPTNPTVVMPSPTIYVGGYKTPDYDDLVGTSHPPRQAINTNNLAALSYGVKELNKVSSVYVRELSDDVSKYLRREIHDVSECKRVWLCTEVNYQGECIVFTRRKDNNTLDFPDSEYRKHPDVWIVPVDIIFLRPVDLNESLRTIDPEITALKTNTPLKRYIEGQTDLEEKSFDIKDVFNDKIKSIKIEDSDTGTCMVVLYENSYLGDANFPGKSEVFFKSDPDLEDHKIHQCRYFRRLLIWINQPCVSAIAVFPVKK